MSLLDSEHSHAKRKADTLPEGLRLVKRPRNDYTTDECGGSTYAHGSSCEEVLGAMATVASSELSSNTLPVVALPPLRSMFPPPTTISKTQENRSCNTPENQWNEEDCVLNSLDLDFDPESDDMDELDGEMWASKMLLFISHNPSQYHHPHTSSNNNNIHVGGNSSKKEESMVLSQEVPPPVIPVKLNSNEQHYKSSVSKDRTNNNNTIASSPRSLRPPTTVPSFSRPPVFSSCSEKKGKKKKRRGHFPKATTDLLKQWLFEHLDHPYPTEEEKAMLAEDTGLSVKQINYWFTNSRRRFLKKGVE